jgi:hypothetical protein
MKRICVADAACLDAERRQQIEAVVGAPLEPGQQVCIMVYTPNQVPSEDLRRLAAANLQRLFERADAYADQKAISDDEIDAAVDDALNHVRGRQAN